MGRTDIPGPPGHVLGWRFNAYRFHRDPIAYMEHAHREFGPVAAFEAGKQGPVFVFGAQLNRAIMENSKLFHSVGLGMKSPPDSAQERMAYGIFSLNDAEHTKVRAALSPAFSRGTTLSHYDQMVDITDAQLQTWSTGTIVDLQSKARDLALQLSVRTVLGLEGGPLAQRLGDLLEEWVEAFTSVWYRLVPVRLPGFAYERGLQAARRLEAEWKRVLATECQRTTGAGRPTATALVALLDLSESKCPHESREGHLNLLFSASHDTTASALSWTLFLLAQHPAITSALAAEIRAAAGTDPPTCEELERMDLLDRVIKESLRLLSPAVFSSRCNTEVAELGGYELPAGTIVTFSPFVTHRLPELFEDPLVFNPDRWLSKNPGPYAYLPFGAGRRRCIGRGFAMLSLKVAVAMILQRFRFVLREGARIDTLVRITLRARKGIPATLSGPDGPTRRVVLRGSINRIAPPSLEERSRPGQAG